MDAEQTIAEIERLERIFAVPDARPLSPSDLTAANRKHDEMLSHSRGFVFGNGTGFAAEVKPKAGIRFRASAAFPVECQYQQGISYTNQSAATQRAHETNCVEVARSGNPKLPRKNHGCPKELIA